MNAYLLIAQVIFSTLNPGNGATHNEMSISTSINETIPYRHLHKPT